MLRSVAMVAGGSRAGDSDEGSTKWATAAAGRQACPQAGPVADAHGPQDWAASGRWSSEHGALLPCYPGVASVRAGRLRLSGGLVLLAALAFTGAFCALWEVRSRSVMRHALTMRAMLMATCAAAEAPGTGLCTSCAVLRCSCTKSSLSSRQPFSRDVSTCCAFTLDRLIGSAVPARAPLGEVQARKRGARAQLVFLPLNVLDRDWRDALFDRRVGHAAARWQQEVWRATWIWGPSLPGERAAARKIVAFGVPVVELTCAAVDSATCQAAREAVDAAMGFAPQNCTLRYGLVSSCAAPGA